MIPKEVHNMANRLKIGSAMTKVDCVRAVAKDKFKMKKKNEK